MLKEISRDVNDITKNIVTASRCPWGCGEDRIVGAPPIYVVRCHCGGLVPSPQTQMFAKLDNDDVVEWIKERS